MGCGVLTTLTTHAQLRRHTCNGDYVSLMKQALKDVTCTHTHSHTHTHTHTQPEISYAPRDALRAWQEKNIQWLEWTDVHRETTKGIRVTVIPFYVGYKAMNPGSSSNGGSGGNTSSHVHWWRYNIRLENLAGERVQLRERYWKIYSTSGTLETVKGKGVVGQVSKGKRCG